MPTALAARAAVSPSAMLAASGRLRPGGSRLRYLGLHRDRRRQLARSDNMASRIKTCIGALILSLSHPSFREPLLLLNTSHICLIPDSRLPRGACSKFANCVAPDLCVRSYVSTRGAFERPRSPEEIMNKLEERVGA